MHKRASLISARGRSAIKSASYVLAALLAAACAPKFNKTDSSIDAVSSTECDSVMSPETTGGAKFCPSHATLDITPAYVPTTANNLIVTGYGNNMLQVVCDPGQAGGGICAHVSAQANGSNIQTSGATAGVAGGIYNLAGTGYPVNSGDGSAATGAGFYKPTATGMDTLGNVVIAVPTYHTIRVICFNTGVGGICDSTVMGVSGGYLINTPGVAATVGNVYTLAGGGGTQYAYPTSDHGAHSTNTSCNYGPGNPCFAGQGTAAYLAVLNYPKGVAVDSQNNVIIADTNNNRVRVVCFSTEGVCSNIAGGAAVAGDIYTFAGGGTVSGCLDSIGDGCVAATASTLNQPVSVAVDSNFNVAIADGGDYRVRLVCGSLLTAGAVGGLCSGASAIDGSGNLNGSGATGATSGDIYTVAGNSSSTKYSAGVAATTSGVSDMVAGVGFDSSQNLFISDPGNTIVTVVCNTGHAGVCSGTVTGSGSISSTGASNGTEYSVYTLDDGGSGSDMYAKNTELFRAPAGIGFNAASHAIGYSTGMVIVSDKANNIIRYMNY